MPKSHNAESQNMGLNPQLEDNKQLKEEYLAGIVRLNKLIESYGLKSLVLVAVGSLTRNDKNISYNPNKIGSLNSDADFVCLVKKPLFPRTLVGFKLFNDGQTVVLKQEDEGQSLPNVSEHIPYFQVEFLTDSQCLKILTTQAKKLEEFKNDFLNNLPTSKEEFDDLLDTIRGFKSALLIYRDLYNGILLDGSIPQEIEEINQKITFLFEEIYIQVEKIRLQYS